MIASQIWEYSVENIVSQKTLQVESISNEPPEVAFSHPLPGIGLFLFF
jgi:hypothetical protein